VAYRQNDHAFSIDFSGLSGFGECQGLNFFQGLKGDKDGTGPQVTEGPLGQGVKCGDLIVVKHVVKSNLNPAKDSDYIIHIDGNDQVP
jgi:hypothetical protein